MHARLTCLLLDEFDVRFFSLLGFLLFCKIFHWISQDRIDFMDQGDAPTRIFHLKILCVMLILVMTDISMLVYSVEYTFRKGASMMIIFGFEVSF